MGNDTKRRRQWDSQPFPKQFWWNAYPMVKVGVPFVAGMVVGLRTAGHFTAWAPAMAIALGMLTVALVYFHFCNYSSVSRRFKSNSFGVAATLYAFILGCFLFSYRFHRAERGVGEAERVVEGVVCAAPVRKPKTWAVEVRRENGSRVLAYVRVDDADARQLPHVGDTVAMRALHWQPTSPHHVDTEDTLGTFAFYHSYLFYRGVSATCFVPEGQWRLLGNWGGASIGGWRETAMRTRERIANHYAAQGLDGQASSVVAAMTIGQRTGLSPSLRQDFADAGLSHVLALSGFHLTIVLTILNGLLLRGLLPLAWRRALVVGVVPVLWGYVLLAGSPASLVRAAVIATAGQLCYCRGQRVGLVNALATAACLMLCIDPFAMMDVGFQLSFSSMLGIALVALPVMRWIGPLPWGVGFVVHIALVTLSATLFTLPLTVLHFGQFALLGVLANVPGSLLALGVMWVAVLWWLSALLPWWPAAHAVLGSALAWLANALVDWADWVGALPGAAVTCTINWPQVAALYAILLSAVGFVRWRKIWMLETTLAAFIAFGVLTLFTR